MAALRVLGRADPNPVAAGVVASILAMIAWSEGVWRSVRPVLAVSDSMPVRRAYLAGVFVRDIVPWGHVGSVALLSYLLGRSGDVEFEQSFAAVGTNDFLNMTASGVVGVIGLGYVVLSGVDASSLELGGLAVLGLVVLLAAAWVVLFRQRWLVGLILRVVAPLHRLAGRLVPPVAGALERDAVLERLDRFFDAVESVVSNRSAVGWAFAANLGAWLLIPVPLVMAFEAVNVHLGYPVAMFVVPVAGLAAIVPVPGGLGSVDAALAGLCATITGHPLPVVGAAVLIYRVTTFWLHFAIAGASVTTLPGGLPGVGRAGERDSRAR